MMQVVKINYVLEQVVSSVFFAMGSLFNGQSAMNVEIYQVVSSVFFEMGSAFNGQSAMNVDIYLFYGLFTPKRHFKTDFIK